MGRQNIKSDDYERRERLGLPRFDPDSQTTIVDLPKECWEYEGDGVYRLELTEKETGG